MAHAFSGRHVPGGPSGAVGALNAVAGGNRESAVKFTVDAAYTYTTGGLVATIITPAALGLSQILFMGPVVFSNGYIGYWDDANSKLKVFSAMGTELANASTALQGASALIQAGGI